MVEDKSLNEAIQNIDYTQTTDKIVTGTATGAVGGVAGAAANKATNAIVNSTRGVQSTMSKNITETTKTLNNMGATNETTTKAVNKIVDGMGNVGNTTNKAVLTIEVGTTVTTDIITKTIVIEDK